LQNALSTERLHFLMCCSVRVLFSCYFLGFRFYSGGENQCGWIIGNDQSPWNARKKRGRAL